MELADLTGRRWPDSFYHQRCDQADRSEFSGANCWRETKPCASNPQGKASVSRALAIVANPALGNK